LPISRQDSQAASRLGLHSNVNWHCRNEGHLPACYDYVAEVMTHGLENFQKTVSRRAFMCGYIARRVTCGFGASGRKVFEVLLRVPDSVTFNSSKGYGSKITLRRG